MREYKLYCKRTYGGIKNVQCLLHCEKVKCVSESVCAVTHTAVSLCVLVLEMYREGRVPQAIKSIFQELQSCCRLQPAPLKTNTRGEEEGWIDGEGEGGEEGGG